MDLTNLNNPHIVVHWEDEALSFSQEKVRRIKAYFQEKYKTKSVTVKTIAVADKTSDAKLKTLEVSDSITDPTYQKNIVKEYINNSGIDVNWELLSRLDDKVNDTLYNNEDVTIVRYNKWTLKKIEFSNFLSFGESNVLDYQNLGGITVIQGANGCENFSGKTTYSVDVLMFLLFNTTTKTKTQEEVFNQFSDKNEVVVKGYLEIDGFDYTIERKLTRKRKRNGEWDVKSEIQYQKKNAEGEWENLNDEDRPKTDKLISSIIGNKEDFLMTILSTANNLENLLEAKPTPRGQLLTKFLGLETFKKKEQICKDMYDEWAKKRTSNNYNTESLKIENERLETSINEATEAIGINNQKLDNDVQQLKFLAEQKEMLLTSKHQDIDVDLIKIKPELFKKEILTAEQTIETATKTYEDFLVVEPSSYYKEDEHSAAQQELNNLKVTLQVQTTESLKTSNQITELKTGKVCPTCKRALDEVDHTEEILELEKKVSETQKYTEELKVTISKMETIVSGFQNLKKQFDDYERNKLKKEKMGLEIEQHKSVLEKKKTKLSEWEKNKTKLEQNLEVERKLVDVRTSIDVKEGEIQSWKDKITAAQKIIERSKEKIKENNTLISQIKKEEGVQKIFQTYLSVFGKNGIAKVVLKNMIPLINQELVRILADTCNFSLVIDINEKNEVEFIMVDNETRVQKAMSTGSGYEKTVASLALRAVLSKVSTLPKPNIIVMDEVFGKVADENLELVGEFFMKIRDYFEHIFLITHNQLIKNWANHVVVINKENNISFVENKLASAS